MLHVQFTQNTLYVLHPEYAANKQSDKHELDAKNFKAVFKHTEMQAFWVCASHERCLKQVLGAIYPHSKLNLLVSLQF